MFRILENIYVYKLRNLSEMKATYIEYKDTQSFSKNLLAYLNNDPVLQPFFGHRPDWEGLESQIKSKAAFAHRALLVRSLREQYGEELLSSSPEVAENISRLQDPQTFTVTTGHQLNIFTGPLYFIFKIVSTIRLAQDLKEQFPEYEFVPVYWMATEDHDFQEINHTKVFGKTISWQVPDTAATGRISTETITETVKEYCNTFGLSENASQLTELVHRAYLHSPNLADATRYFVNSLFKQYGLIVLDADQRSLKEIFSPVIQDDIINQHSYRTISTTSKALGDLGFSSQVHPREINFFYLTDQFRERIVQTDDGDYEVLHQPIRWNKAELIKEIQQHPERFSPNVVTRPLYQEMILPNLAYVGGGAEISYWLQLKACFDHYGQAFPVLIPRNSALITDDQTAGKVYRLDLTFKSIFKPADTLKNDFVKRQTKHRLNLQDERMELNAVFAKIKLRTHKIDPSLGPSTEAVKARLKKALNSLEKKLLKAEKRNHQEALIQIQRLKDKLFPGGALQERTDNFAELYLKHGVDLIPELMKSFNPLDFKFTILY